VASFNRAAKRGHWGLLENLVLRQARTEKYCLFAGPVFRANDRLFLGVDDEGPIRVPIPRQFWKIVVAPGDGGLQTFAFILDQDLSGTDFESVAAVEFAVDRSWRERMISLPDLAELVAPLSFPAELLESDQFDAGPGEAVRAHASMESYAG
jgi:endonuclease G, mitochondrial